MHTSQRPDINAQYTNPHGELFTVIGTGTQGIIIEYQDGRVELVSNPDWKTQGHQRAYSVQH